MALINEIYEFEGDSSQTLSNGTWKSPEFLYASRKAPRMCRVIFDEGDFAAYQALVDTRNDTIKRNLDKISNYQGEGFPFGDYQIGGDNLETVPSVPTYTGDQELTVTVYFDGSSYFAKTVYESGMFRIPAGERPTKWSFQVEGNVASLDEITFASSGAALKGEA